MARFCGGCFEGHELVYQAPALGEGGGNFQLFLVEHDFEGCDQVSLRDG